MSLDPIRGADAAVEVDCSHCGLPVPAHLRVADAPEQFCCAACRTVYAAIRGCGLEAFYRIRTDTDPRRQALVSGKNYLPFDEPAFHERHVETLPDGSRRAKLYLEGVHCGACVWLVERLPNVLPGVLVSRLDLARQVVEVCWDADRIQLSEIGRTLDRLGYPAHGWSDDRRDALRTHETRAQWIRIGIAGACAGNVMLIAFALYGGHLSGMERIYESFFRWASLGITLIALLGPGRVFFRGALSSLRTGTMHMDLPVAIALAAGTTWGAINTFRGSGKVYFESITAVVFLLLIGRWLQHRQNRAAQDAVAMLFSLTPSTAIRLDEEGEREVSVSSLQRGDRVRVRAGDEVPVDGTILSGTSDMDVSLLTGESAPIRAVAGDSVHAGTQNLSEPLVVEALSTGAATRVGQLMEQVERLARDRAPLVRLADRVAHGFVLTVLVAAGLTAIGWWHVSPDSAIENAITLLIVTCPCALGLATPLAVLAAIGRAAERGILIQGGEVLERLSRPGHIWIDKTGTLTVGALNLAEWRGDEELEPLIVSLERGVRHPIAAAFLRAFGQPDAGVESTGSGKQVAGSGVSGDVGGRNVRIGKPLWVRDGAQVPEWVEEQTRQIEQRALSAVWVSVDGQVRGVAGFGDQLRPEAPAVVRALRELGWKVSILSGDRRAVVESVADDLGLTVDPDQSDVTPEGKVDRVQRCGAARQGRPVSGRTGAIVMVGDGVNDAAALSAADVGVAVHGGAPVSLGAADVYLQREGLTPLLELVVGAGRVVHVMRRNVLLSLGYNVIAATLAIGGVINPMIAAILMPLSSLTVVASSYRSRTFTEWVPRR